MGVNSLPKTVTRHRRDCNLNPGPSAPESSTLTTRLHRATLNEFTLTELFSTQFWFVSSFKIFMLLQKLAKL